MNDLTVSLITAIAPILVALIGILPAIFTTSNKTKKAVDDVEKKLDNHIKDDDWARAKQCRIRILRFNDEICEGKRHSENHFEEILEDIDSYEKFCASHADYINNKGKFAMAHIEETYKECKKNNTFLN